MIVVTVFFWIMNQSGSCLIHNQKEEFISQDSVSKSKTVTKKVEIPDFSRKSLTDPWTDDLYQVSMTSERYVESCTNVGII